MPSLKPYHTFSLDTQCAYLAKFSCAEELLALRNKYANSMIIGEGSNTVFLTNFDGAVLINAIKGIHCVDTKDAFRVKVGAGENWHSFVEYCLAQGWYGLENLALIPGTVGACPIQNIGAYGVEVSRYIESVEFVYLDTGTSDVMVNENCEFGYRDSIFKRDLANKVLITQVNFLFPKQNALVYSYGELSTLVNPTPQNIFDRVVHIRKSKLPDPNVLGNAGSFFKNPVITLSAFEVIKHNYENVPHYVQDNGKVKIPAAWLIDSAGIKGEEYKGIRCHPMQPLVLTNVNNAKGEDLVAFAKSIIIRVKDLFGVQLEPEVRLVGSEGLITL